MTARLSQAWEGARENADRKWTCIRDRQPKRAVRLGAAWIETTRGIP
jgi:hypothetical protein